MVLIDKDVIFDHNKIKIIGFRAMEDPLFWILTKETLTDNI